jgi:hypothetical protein
MIEDIIEEIKKVNKMIDLHATSYPWKPPHDFMLTQYQRKRDELIAELEKELLKLNIFDEWKEWKNQ